MGYIYLASPYVHPNPEVVKERADAILKITGIYMAKGCHIYSPIVHNHPVAVSNIRVGDWDHTGWMDFDEPFLLAAEELWVAKLPGWKESCGVHTEISLALNHEPIIRVFYQDVRKFFTDWEWDILSTPIPDSAPSYCPECGQKQHQQSDHHKFKYTNV